MLRAGGREESGGGGKGRWEASMLESSAEVGLGVDEQIIVESDESTTAQRVDGRECKACAWRSRSLTPTG